MPMLLIQEQEYHWALSLFLFALFIMGYFNDKAYSKNAPFNVFYSIKLFIGKKGQAFNIIR